MKNHGPPARESSGALDAPPRQDGGASPELPRGGNRGGPSPVSAQAHYRIGLIHQERGKLEKAAEHLAAAARLAPADPRFAFSLAGVRQLQGRTAEAAGLYEKTLAIDPGCAQAHYNLGVIAMEAGRFESAAAHFTEAIAREPGLPQAHNNLGAAWMALGRSQQAAASFDAAIRLDARCVAAHHNFGRLCFSGREWGKAIAHFQHALELGADPHSALIHIGLCHHANGSLDAAERCYLRILEGCPNDVEAFLNLARLSLDRKDPARARHWCLKAASVQPERADAILRSGQILEQCGFFEEALASRYRALRLRPEDPGIRFDRALLLLRMGRFAEAWPDYEWRFKRPNWPQAYPHRIAAPRWDGAPFRGKTLLVHCEQGYGDTLQFARYLPLAKARGGRVLFEVPGPLVRLFRKLPGVDEILELSAAAITRRPFDLHIPLLSLPGLFGTTLDTVPANLPFIAPEPAKVSGWRQRLGDNTVKIGIVWAGSAWHHNDRQRSCPLSLFLQLARMPGIRLVALQKGEASEAVGLLPEGVPLVNAGPELQDFSDTADLVAALDLVITVDTAAAHLAAIMETPTWVVVPFPADWRWLLGREDSPWYPTLRLFRQTRRGCWQEVFTAVERALRALIEERRTRPAVTPRRPTAPVIRD